MRLQRIIKERTNKMKAFKKLSLLLIVACLLVCVMAFVSCNNDSGDTNTNTATDTATNTATDSSTDTATDSETDSSTEGAVPQGYAVFVCDEEGNGIPAAMVVWCDVVTETDCVNSFTNDEGYAIHSKMSPSYCVKKVMADGYENFEGAISFSEEAKLVTITLSSAN